MSSPSFWDDQSEAKRVSSECNRLKQLVEKIENFRNQVGDVEAMAELCEEDEDDAAMLKEFSKELSNLIEKIEDLEVESFLSEPMDIRPALLSIHAGAGGTESCDWADMLMRMYVRWAERRDLRLIFRIYNLVKKPGSVDAPCVLMEPMPMDIPRPSVGCIDWSG